MSAILNLSESLQRVGSEIANAEGQLARHPFDRGMQLELKSLVKWQRRLEDEFAAVANTSGREVCRYTLSGRGVEAAANVFLAYAEFQKLLTAGYTSIKHGRRTRLRFSDDDVRATSLGFSYSLAGSITAVFTIPNDRLLFDDDQTVLDQSIDLIFEMAQAGTIDAIQMQSHRYGAALVHALYDWSEAHARFDLCADIAWKRANAVRNALHMQPPQFASLNELIRRTGGDLSSSFTVDGVLIAASLKKKTFTFTPDDGGDISGTFFDAISKDHVVQIPQRYRAVIATHSSIVFSTEEEKLTHFLESLAPLKPLTLPH